MIRIKKQSFDGAFISHVLVREEILLWKISSLDLIRANKRSILGCAGKVADTLHTAIVLTQGLIVLDADPKA